MSDRIKILRTALEHLKAGRFDQCATLCRPLLEADQGDVDARFFLGVCLGAGGQLDEAVEHLTTVIQARPDHIDARRELARMLQAQGLTLIDQGQVDEAITVFGQAVAADPANAAGHANLGNALATEGRFDESLAAITDALRLSPADIDINVNRAVTLLKAGRLPEGWAANEWRHKKPGREKLPPPLMLPKLAHLGDVARRTIVIYHEEGFGDTIQFLRYAQLLAEAGARIILWAPQELVRLMRGQAGIAEVLTGNVNLPQFDYHCPIISLPYVFDTVIDTIPAETPYITADAALTAEWAARLPPGPRVGLVWAGEPRSYDPVAQALDRRRSLPFKMLLPLTVTPGMSFVSLQTGPARGQIAGGVHDPMGGVKDFADTAAIIANLDAVVSADTAVAHLAGAMGKPVFLLDRYDNCWRWFHGRADSPWYPTLMIFRQTRMGDWLEPVTEAAETLGEFFRMSNGAIRVLAAGMVGSGSTYLYNVIREILASDPRIPSIATYSDAWNPLFMVHQRLVLKSHCGAEALTPLAERGVLLPVVSVRHPGDSVCSDMERFGFAFDVALKRVELSLKFCAALRPLQETVLYRYEDRFAANPRTAAGLAQILGIRLPAERLAEIARKYDAASVRAYAEALDGVPNLMRTPNGDAWCPTTQIHRGHIGKQAPGRWRDLPDAQRRLIDEACGEDALSFGYDCVG